MMNLAVAIKVSIAMMLIGILTGCGKKEGANLSNLPAPSATSGAVSRTPPVASAPVSLTSYAETAVPMSAGHCSLDAINGKPKVHSSVRRGSEATFGGWISDDANKVPTDARFVFLGAGKAYTAPLAPDVERPDVVAALNADALLHSGFNLQVRTSMPAGIYRLAITFGPVTAGKSCSLDASLNVTD